MSAQFIGMTGTNHRARVRAAGGGLKVRYEFTVASEIRVKAGQWSRLEVEREGKRWAIDKPCTCTEPLIAPRVLQGGRFRVGQLPGMAKLVRMSFFGVECDEETQPKLDSAVLDPVVKLADNLLAWVRTLTGQYWIGYKDTDFLQRHVTVGVVDGNRWKEKPTAVGFGLGFTYGQELDQSTWQTIGARLARGEKPAAARVFFCDALGEIAEGDLTQAVVALGIACELEAQALVDEFIAQQPSRVQGLLHRHVNRPFKKSIGALIRDLGGDSFEEVAPGAAKLVHRLYNMRGQAAHSGMCTFEEDRKTVTLELSGLPAFVAAVGELLAWSDGQRSKLAR